MKKILLIISLALLWSFNVNAQVQTATKAIVGTKKGIVTDKKIAVEIPGGGLRKAADAVSNPNCRTRYTAQEALDATADGNVNMFGAVYSGVTTRSCEEKAPAAQKNEAERDYEDIEEDIEERAYILEMPPAAK